MIKCVAINQLSKSKNESVFVLIVKFKVFSQPDGLQLKEVGGFSSNALAETDISPTTNFSAGQKTANFF